MNEIAAGAILGLLFLMSLRVDDIRTELRSIRKLLAARIPIPETPKSPVEQEKGERLKA